MKALFRRILFAPFLLLSFSAFGADITNFASGLESGALDIITKDECSAVDVSTDAPRTGSKCLTTKYNGNNNKRWCLTPTFAVPKNSYLHIIAYTKLNAADGTTSNTSAYASTHIGGDKNGSSVNLTTSWKRITATSNKTTSDKTGATARFYRKHKNSGEVLFDDIIAYVSTNSSVDVVAPDPVTSYSATDTTITWTCGSDANTGVQATLIWRRIEGTAEDLTLNNQGIYSLTETEGPQIDKSGHWELVRVLAGDATTYNANGTFVSKEVYAIVHRDLAYNYSAPRYVTIPDKSVKTLYLIPSAGWKTDGARFAVNCFDSEGDKWYDMELVDAGCSSTVKLYKAEVSAKYTGVIFCRMNGSTTENNWDNKWNQTGDLTMPTAEAGVYEVPSGQWDGSDNTHWKKQPLNICVVGNWLCFAGEQLTLTATSTGATHYQWYKGSTAESNKIPGATTATYINNNFAFEDAGDYYCKSRIGTGAEITSEKFTVKTLRIYFNVEGEGGSYSLYRIIDLHKSDPDNHIAVGMGFLGQNWDYIFQVTDGCGNYYGRINTKETGMNKDNHTDWPMYLGSSQCHFHSENGATYTFYVDYTNMNQPVVSVIYPPTNQAPGYKIYFDNSLVNWSNLHYRIGNTGYTSKTKINLVPGTANLYKYETVEWNNLRAWHIADNCGYSGSYNIYQTNASTAYEISNSVNFEGGAIQQDITIVPIGTHSTGGDDYNNHCEFYNYNMLQGMKTQNVMINEPENGTITVSYTDVDGSGKFFTSGDRDLAHTCILTISAEPSASCGYQLASLYVNGSPLIGNTYILNTRTTIDAEFEPTTYSVALHPNGGLILSGDVTEYTYTVGATLPTPSQISLIGKDFKGWYDNPGLTGTPVTEISVTECGDKEYWAKWEDEEPKVTYILGSCYVKNGMWTAGNDGNVSAWMFIPGATVSENTLIQTTDISYSSSNTGPIFFNSKDIKELNDQNKWGASSSSDRTIKAINMGKDETITFGLGGLQAKSIAFYVFPNTTKAYSIDLMVNGITTNQPISKDQQNKWHKYLYKGGTYTGEFSITSNGEGTRVVVVVEVPTVTITFDKNDGAIPAVTTTQIVPKGQTVELDNNTFYRTDYIFRGWTEDPAGTGELILDGALYTANTDVTLYAKWEETIKTTITLDATGAANAYTQSVVATYTMPMPEISRLPIRTGYVFDGYYDGPDGTGVKYYSGLGGSVRNWDKPVLAATLYAKWVLPCELQPALANVVPIVTIWDHKAVDMGVVRLSCDFDTTGIKYDLLSVEPTNPINGCHFEYFDEQIHLIGTPNENITSVKEVTVTFKMANNCTPASIYPVTQTIRIYPEDQKPKIAFIITGTKNGAFTAYDADDAAACNALVTYLSTFYDVTFVNGYATKNESELATYYAAYDLLVVTDFLNTQEGYTNAIGTLIDKKPILSFEAYVANQSNWHIGSNPKDPKPKVQDMKVLCAGHAIFKNAKYEEGDAEETVVVRADTTVNVLASLSSAEKAKGLQGFTINEAPDFIFLATIRDANSNRDLIVCCERQVAFPARLMLYGINFYEMGNLSQAGHIIIRQMIDYLLMTDETKVADCSLVFDNGFDSSTGTTVAGGGDHLWSNPKNWSPGRSIIPTAYHGARIIAECWVDKDDAHAGSVKVNKGRDENGRPVDGKIIVKPYGGLTVAGLVTKVNDTRYASPIVLKADELLIEADEEHNGAFVYGNKESDVRATVQYFSRATDAKESNPIWQYMGIPFQAGQTAISMYYAAWMCRWASGSTDGLGGLWQWVENEDVLMPFEGYCITQESQKTYEFAGKLNAPVTRTIALDNQDKDGYAFAANSWTAPIKIQEMEDADFINAEKTIYIFHTGSYKNWQDYGTPPLNAHSGSAATLPGQYAAVPIHSSPYLTGADSVIPTMQGFFIKTTAADAKLKLVYNRTVYDAKYFKTSTQPMRAPSRVNIAPAVMELFVSGETSGGDRIHLLARSDFSDDFQDGWDGRKLDGDANAPMLAVVKESGDMSVAAIQSLDDRELLFRAGKDTHYTFSFEYEGETIYLYDRLTKQATQILTGNTYSFESDDKTASKRFLITTHPEQTPTSVSLVETGDNLHFENYRKELVIVRIVDMQGRVLYTTKTTDEIVHICPSLPYGVYLAHITMGNETRVVRMIGKEDAP